MKMIVANVFVECQVGGTRDMPQLAPVDAEALRKAIQTFLDEAMEGFPSDGGPSWMVTTQIVDGLAFHEPVD